MIRLENLSCCYGEKTVFQNISLDIDKDLSILGANGSGKSTLAKALCNLVEYDGKISIGGKDIKEFSPKQRAKLIAYIPTKLEVYDAYISLYDFVLLGRFAHKESFFPYSQEDKKIAQKYIDLLQLTSLIDHPLHSLSSGETALPLIAQALTQESKIIIFDEPTANLDPKNAKIIAKHIKNLKQTHQTVLITHDIHLAHFIDSPVLFLKSNRGVYFENGFFSDENLSKLYEVKISSLEVQYD